MKVFNAFTGPPRILRLFGHGRVLERDTPEFNKLLPPGDGRRFAGARAIVWLDIERVGTSCGYSVPYYHYEGERCVPFFLALPCPCLFAVLQLDESS